MKKCMTLVILSLITLMVSAQTDFSGKWKLNKEKSTLNEQFSMAPPEMIIVHTGNDMDVEKHVSFDGNEFTIKDKYTLDGKECINQGMMDTKKKSTAVFSEDKTSLTIISKMSMDDGSDMTIKEVYLIENGNLVLNSSSSSSWGEMKEKMVYDKQ
jgi:hypothetical protein